MYRENFYDVMRATGEKIDAVAIPKNSGLKGYVWRILREAGVDIENAKQIRKGELMVGGVTYWLQRGSDIPHVVEQQALLGKFVLGITGDDLFDEFKLQSPSSKVSLINTYDWSDDAARYLRPALCLIGKKGTEEVGQSNVRVAINSKYPLTSRQYLAKSPRFDGRVIGITEAEGDIEKAIVRGVSDLCIDQVYTGETLQMLGLDVIEKIRFSDVAVIAPTSLSSLVQREALLIPRGQLISRG